jgi:hypothetical protein
MLKINCKFCDKRQRIKFCDSGFDKNCSAKYDGERSLEPAFKIGTLIPGKRRDRVGAMTFSIMSPGIMTFSIMTISITINET